MYVWISIDCSECFNLYSSQDLVTWSKYIYEDSILIVSLLSLKVDKWIRFPQYIFAQAVPYSSFFASLSLSSSVL